MSNVIAYLRPSTDHAKKWMVIIISPKAIAKQFILKATGYDDFTMHHDLDRRAKYIKRHASNNGNWNNIENAGFLSKWLLWEEPTILKSIQMIRLKFHMQIERTQPPKSIPQA